MIQQISIIQATPNMQTQPAQAQPETQSFESVIQKTMGRLDRGKADKAISGKPESGKGKPSEQKTDPVGAQAASVTVNGSLLLQQLQQPQAMPAIQVNPAVILVQETAGDSLQPVAGLIGPSANVQNASASGAVPLPVIPNAAQQNPYPQAAGSPDKAIPSAPATGKSDFQAVGTGILPMVPQQTVDSVKHTSYPAVEMQQTTDSAKPQQAQDSHMQKTSAPVQSESVIPVVQLVQPDTPQLSSGTKHPETASLPLKQELPVEKADSSDQPPVSFPDMMQTGNVIIKISDAASNTVKTVSHQVADKVSVNYKAGNPEFQMDLFPKDLGKVTVKLAVEKGTLTVQISAENPKTQSMLLSNTGDIRSLIESTVSHPVQIMDSSQDRQWYQQNQDQQQSRQQERQQKQPFGYRTDEDDANRNADDFLTVMQQLRVQAYTV